MTEDLPFPEREEQVQPERREITNELVPKITNESILTKSSIHDMAEKKAVKIIKEGDIDPLAAYLRTKALIEFYTQLGKKLHGAALNESGKYMKTESSLMGIEFAITSSPRKFDYSHDSEWVKIKQGMDKLKKELEARQDFLKELKKELVDKDGGEVISPAKHVSGGKDILKVTIKK